MLCNREVVPLEVPRLRYRALGLRQLTQDTGALDKLCFASQASLTSFLAPPIIKSYFLIAELIRSVSWRQPVLLLPL